MSAEELQGLDDMKPDASNLYREEMYSDLKVATIRKLVPVTIDGTDDTAREPMFIAQTSISSPAGNLPVNSPIEAKTLAEAIEKFPDAIKAGVEKMMADVREYQRQEASKIVVPGQGGGGRIQL